VNEREIQAIAAHIQEEPERFVSKYCETSCGKKILAQGSNGYCVFWQHDCRIHPVKPHMCKAWPFIESVLIDVHNWHIMAQFCPGMRTDIPDSQIIACIREELCFTEDCCYKLIQKSS